MIITKLGTILKIGNDLADTFIGKHASHGELEINNGKRYQWQSVFPIHESEKALRLAAKSEGCKITLFISQAK